MAEPLGNRLQHAWNAFRSRDPTKEYLTRQELGYMSFGQQNQSRIHVTNERSVIISVYNRIAMDVAALKIQHVMLDENGNYMSNVDSGLNYCLTTEANIDQTHTDFIQDVVLSMFDEGVVAVVPVDTTIDPNISNSYDIQSLRTGRITAWYPRHVRVRLYNDNTGNFEELLFEKRNIAIIQNPMYAVMNEPNSTLKRLLRKLTILDAIDEQSGAGKLDLIIQLPYVIKTEARRQQADQRRKDIEMQLAGSKYGIAYTDGTERVTQLNRPAENNLMSQIQYLTSMLYSQLGLTEDVFNGTADEKTMLNYNNRTIDPILSAIVNEFRRKFLTKTARAQHKSVMYFDEPFKLMSANDLANAADKFTRNEILSSNEVRGLIGFKPSKDPKADELRNKNINQSQNGSSNAEVPLDNEQDGIVESLLSTLEGSIDDMLAGINSEEVI